MIATAILVTIIINIVITDNEKWNNKLTLIRARNWIHCTRHWKRKSKNVQIIRINSIISVITRKTFLASEKLQSVELFFSLPFVEDRVFLNSFKYHNWSHSITPINWYDDRGKNPNLTLSFSSPSSAKPWYGKHVTITIKTYPVDDSNMIKRQGKLLLLLGIHRTLDEFVGFCCHAQIGALATHSWKYKSR